jgi:hypothetical protein
MRPELAPIPRPTPTSPPLSELGIDLAEIHPMPVTDEALAGADVIVTMGRSVGAVTIPPGARHEDWRIGDPVGADLDEVRRIRDEIDHRVRSLVAALAPPRHRRPTKPNPRRPAGRRTTLSTSPERRAAS